MKAANGKIQQRSFDDEVQGFNSKVLQQSLEVFLHYWQSSTVRAHYSRSSTAFWCQWQTLVKFTHHFCSSLHSPPLEWNPSGIQGQSESNPRQGGGYSESEQNPSGLQPGSKLKGNLSSAQSVLRVYSDSKWNLSRI